LNSEQGFTKVIEVFNCYRPVPSGLYVLFVHDKKLGLCPRWAFNGEGEEIIQLGARDINVGLRRPTWETIQHRLVELERKGVL
jgi:hypothetical protein